MAAESGMLLRLGPQVLRYHLVWFCDLDTLLRLNHVCRTFRSLLNNPDVVSEWLTLCWYVEPRHCRCEREQYHLNLERLCPFMWDYRGGDQIRVPHTASETGNPVGVTNQREFQLTLRHLGRSVPMLLQSTQRPMRVPRLPYPHESTDFCPGMYDDLIQGLIVPMPRMVHCPVECTRTGRVDDTPGFWGGFHEITDAMVEDDLDTKLWKQDLPRRPVVEPPSAGFDYHPLTYVDRLAEYTARCESHGLDPYDPNEDTDHMHGYQTEQWARRLLYESAVGLQTFPLHLCLHRDDLCDLAYRSGPTYIERRFLSASRYEGTGGESEVLGTRGVALFYNIRYDNERGDFHTWCLHTQALVQATYHHLWHDYARVWLRGFRLYLMNLAQEIHEDLPISQLCPQWRRLMQEWFVRLEDGSEGTSGGAYVDIHRPPPPDVTNMTHREMELDELAELTRPDPGSNAGLRQRERDRRALRFLMDGAYRTEFLVVQRAVEGWLHRPFPQAYIFQDPYLRDTIPDGQWNSNLYPESALLTDVERLVRVSEFLLEFQQWVGPRVDQRTRMLRRRMHRLYLNSGLSLALWCPHWMRPFPDGHRRGHTGQTVGTPLRLLRTNPQHNHRYQTYLDFLNRRALFHHPQPESWSAEWQAGTDIGRMLRA